MKWTYQHQGQIIAICSFCSDALLLKNYTNHTIHFIHRASSNVTVKSLLKFTWIAIYLDVTRYNKLHFYTHLTCLSISYCNVIHGLCWNNFLQKKHYYRTKKYKSIKMHCTLYYISRNCRWVKFSFIIIL